MFEALSNLVKQITREPPLPPPSSRVFSKIQRIKNKTALEHLREEKAMQAVACEEETEAALEQEMKRTMSKIDELRGST